MHSNHKYAIYYEARMVNLAEVFEVDIRTHYVEPRTKMQISMCVSFHINKVIWLSNDNEKHEALK